MTGSATKPMSRRVLGFCSLLTLGINVIVGVGIFLAPGQLAGVVVVPGQYPLVEARRALGKVAHGAAIVARTTVTPRGRCAFREARRRLVTVCA